MRVCAYVLRCCCMRLCFVLFMVLDVLLAFRRFCQACCVMGMDTVSLRDICMNL
jgi:hypothetical protein